MHMESLGWLRVIPFQQAYAMPGYEGTNSI